jgi:putative membrane protein
MTTAARSLMNTIGPIAACPAGLLQIAIFYLAAIAFSQPKIYRRFLVADPTEAQTVKPWAFNQGFYNLFLAIGTLAGGRTTHAPASRERRH